MGLVFPEESPEEPGDSEVLLPGDVDELPPGDAGELPPGDVEVLLPPGDAGDAAEVFAGESGV